ncbi:MAG: hypothetical protein HYS80_02570 [Candidatus Aenigmarchaeota archaeon]|nr:hypothetical protein [Candidatus Aenigmarchaeota archaeon]
MRIDDEVRKSATAEELRAYERMLLDSVAMRFCVHNGDVFLTDRSDYDVKDGEEPFINWDRWSHHSIHHDLHQMAMEFREMDLLDDHVDVVEFTPDEPEHGKRIGKAINKSDLGEGMDSAKIGKVVAMSPSGGGKVDWKSDDPNKGVHLTPLSHMTSTGTVVYRPTGTPEEMETADGKREKVAFAKGSVEARENLDAYIMRQRYAGGQVQGTDRYQQLSIYESWQRGELNENNMIPVYQDGLPQEDFIMVHLHAMPDWVDEEKVQVVEPDYVLYPEVDMACGSRGGNGSFRSALSKSTWFTARADPEKHFLEDRWIIVKLKGHGIVLLAKSPQEAVRGVKKYTKMKRPIQETV